MAEKKPREEAQLQEVSSKSAGDIESPGEDAMDFELTGLPLALVIIGLALAIFLMSLDSSIISTAIPRITAQFNSTGDIGWYGSAYSFAMCALQPIAGKLFASFSMRNKLVERLDDLGFGRQEIQDILSAGSAEARSVVTEAQLSDVLNAYNYGLTKTFYVATSVAAVAFFVSLGMRWRSVKPPKSHFSADVEAN